MKLEADASESRNSWHSRFPEETANHNAQYQLQGIPCSLLASGLGNHPFKSPTLSTLEMAPRKAF